LFKASDFARGAIDISAFDDWGTKKFADKNQFILVSNEGSGEVTPATVQAKIDQHKPDIVILDYHQLFADNQGSKNPTERNMNISKSFKALAMNNNIPIIDITAATMDDSTSQDSPPLMSQVAWSKAIEYDADMAMAVHRTPDTNIIEVVSRKNRHGTDFGFYLDWDLNRGIVKEIYDTPIQ
jgi:replicative DNA helicase